MKIKCYSELIMLPTFEARLNYLKTNSVVGESTFGPARYVNQAFYNSYLWVKKIRPLVITRDNGCDLALEGYEIRDRIYVHHINPITIEDLEDLTPMAIDLEYLVCMSYSTHLALHFGKEYQPNQNPIERKPFDTCPWKM